jgi:putative transposase
VVSLKTKRAAVSAIKAKYDKLSTRSACKILRLYQSTHYYKAKKQNNDEVLKAKIIELANAKSNDGLPMIVWRLRNRLGFKDNHKRIGRIYREQSLQIGLRKKSRKRLQRKFMFLMPTRPNEVWAMDFVLDSFSNGRRFRVLTVKDLFTREAVVLHVDLSIRGEDVARVLEQMKLSRGLPKTIICDNGSEFVSRAMDQWAFTNKVELKFIQPGKPVQNAFIESFNGRFRADCLNQNWFENLDSARKTIEDWRYEYNHDRPTKALGKETPAEFAQRHGVIL